MVVLLLCGDRRPPTPSTLHCASSGPRKCSVLPTSLVSSVFFAGKGRRTDFGMQALSMTSGWRNGWLVLPCTSFVKWNGNETAEILLLWFRSNPVVSRSTRIVDVEL